MISKKEFNGFLDITFKLYPIILSFFLLLDIYTFKQYNFEIGYLNQILQNINFSTFSVILLFTLSPLIFILIGLIVNNLLRRFSQFTLKKYILPFNEQLAKFNTILFFIFLLIIYLALLGLTLSFKGEISDIYLLLFFMLLQFTFNILGDYIINLEVSYPKNIKWCIFISFVACIVLYITSHYIEYLQSIIFLILLFIYLNILFFFMFIGTGTEIKEKNPSGFPLLHIKNGTNINKQSKSIKLSIVIVSVGGMWFYTHTICKDIWNKPIDMKIIKEDITPNLIFNRAFLINNTDDINITSSNEHNITKVTKNEYPKYLNIGANYKIFFKNSNEENTSITTLIVKEKEFVDREGSEYKVIKKSEYNTTKE